MPILALLVISAGAQTSPQEPPKQPISFSHKTHADAKMECKTCHSNPDPGEVMGIERPSACMSCHKEVKHESPAIQKLAGFVKKDEIKWARVYLLPSFVRFSHRVHTEAGYNCEECHGPVATRDLLARERDISQVGCVACHRAAKAGLGCTFCHE